MCVPHVIEKQIVTFALLSEVIAGIVNDPVGTKRAHQFDILCAAHASYVSPKRLRNLHGKGADSSGRAVNQDLLPRLKVSFVAEPLQRGKPCDWHSSRLVEAQAFRLPD